MRNAFVAARIPKELKEKMREAIEKGFYMNMSDLIRSAIRDKLKEKGEVT